MSVTCKQHHLPVTRATLAACAPAALALTLGPAVGAPAALAAAVPAAAAPPLPAAGAPPAVVVTTAVAAISAARPASSSGGGSNSGASCSVAHGAAALTPSHHRRGRHDSAHATPATPLPAPAAPPLSASAAVVSPPLPAPTAAARHRNWLYASAGNQCGVAGAGLNVQWQAVSVLMVMRHAAKLVAAGSVSWASLGAQKGTTMNLSGWQLHGRASAQHAPGRRSAARPAAQATCELD